MGNVYSYDRDEKSLKEIFETEEQIEPGSSQNPLGASLYSLCFQPCLSEPFLFLQFYPSSMFPPSLSPSLASFLLFLYQFEIHDHISIFLGFLAQILLLYILNLEFSTTRLKSFHCWMSQVEAAIFLG
jgi:hypothetical protein